MLLLAYKLSMVCEIRSGFSIHTTLSILLTLASKRMDICYSGEVVEVYLPEKGHWPVVYTANARAPNATKHYLVFDSSCELSIIASVSRGPAPRSLHHADLPRANRN